MLASGPYAANLLGLSTHVPPRIVYYTDEDDNRVTIGNQTIELRHAGPRHMAGARKVSGLAIQALRYFAKTTSRPKASATVSTIIHGRLQIQNGDPVRDGRLSRA